ncbi:MAG: YfhO family protein [Clostridiales bacterium]|nr:YfhO family protein [Clostridiales bacterium]
MDVYMNPPASRTESPVKGPAYKRVPALGRQKELHWKTFLVALATAAAFFLPFIIMDHGYFFFYGDFNVQQIPFYKMCHQMIREGNIFWNWQTDLGVNFIGSYSFYLLGSPFFWLTLPFPNWMVPYLIAPLLILKFACSAFTAYFYIRRFTRTPYAAMLGGLLYAFSGFSVYNIFFNHFHEAIVFFPVLLLAVEQFIADNRRGALSVAVFICALSNYFFFFGMVVFCAIYWFIRLLAGSWRLTVKRALAFFGEILLGVGLAAVILVPAFFSVMQNSRVTEHLYGWDAILYGKEQIYTNIFQCFFFPPDLPARPVFFPGADVKWSSLGGWLPIFSMTGVVGFLQSKKGHWLRRLLIVLIFMAMVPVLNSAFYAFNSAYYARWYFMPVLMMCLATAMSLEDKEVDWGRAFKWTLGLTLAVALVVGLYPSETKDGAITRFGLFTKDSGGEHTYLIRFWITCAIAVFSLIILKLLLPLWKRAPKSFARLAAASICIVSVIYAAFFIGTGKTNSFDVDKILIPMLAEGQVDLPGDKDEYRIDVYQENAVDNTGMYLGYPCIQAFHSIVPASVMDYYPYVGVERGVASRPEFKSYAVRPFLSVKYLLARQGQKFVDEDGSAKMPGYVYYGSQDGYDIYENQNYIPYGFTYDYYMTGLDCEAYEENQRALLMLKAILLDEEQVKRHQDILQPLSSVSMLRNDTAANAGSGKATVTQDGRRAPDFSNAAFAKDCADRAKTASKSFTADNQGFTAEVELERENLVFFSVPYEEKGWTATVDGQPAEVEQVNVGFMAVRVPAGSHTVRFTYMTPGLPLGLIITAVCLLLLLAYLLVVWQLKRKNPGRWLTPYPEGDRLAARFAADQVEEEAYLEQLALEEAASQEVWEEPESGAPDQLHFQGFSGQPADGEPEDSAPVQPPDAEDDPDSLEEEDDALFIPGFKVDLKAAGLSEEEEDSDF